MRANELDEAVKRAVVFHVFMRKSQNIINLDPSSSRRVERTVGYFGHGNAQKIFSPVN